jgi:hypothetical protein
LYYSTTGTLDNVDSLDEHLQPRMNPKGFRTLRTGVSRGHRGADDTRERMRSTSVGCAPTLVHAEVNCVTSLVPCLSSNTVKASANSNPNWMPFVRLMLPRFSRSLDACPRSRNELQERGEEVPTLTGRIRREVAILKRVLTRVSELLMPKFDLEEDFMPRVRHPNDSWN